MSKDHACQLSYKAESALCWAYLDDTVDGKDDGAIGGEGPRQHGDAPVTACRPGVAGAPITTAGRRQDELTPCRGTSQALR